MLQACAGKKKQQRHIRHDEFISPGPTVKNTKKYTKPIIQEKHGILYFQTGVMQTIRTTTAVQKDKSKADNIFLCSLCSSFLGRRFSPRPYICMTKAVSQMTQHKDARVHNNVRYT